MNKMPELTQKQIEGLAWYAAVEKEVRRIARAAAQKKENKCKKAKVSKSATCSQ